VPNPEQPTSRYLTRKKMAQKRKKTASNAPESSKAAPEASESSHVKGRAAKAALRKGCRRKRPQVSM
jgi:hypothetical protein